MRFNFKECLSDSAKFLDLLIVLGEGVTHATMTYVNAFPDGFPMPGKGDGEVTTMLLSHGMDDKKLETYFSDGFEFGR